MEEIQVSYLSKEEALKSCEEIINDLPEWFGRPEENIKYIADTQRYLSLGVRIGDKVVGLLVYRLKYESEFDSETVNIYWMGILSNYHRQSIGSQLISFLESSIKQNIITVETLDPRVKNSAYLKSFNFYKKLTFQVYKYFEYDLNTPMVSMFKEVR